MVNLRDKPISKADTIRIVTNEGTQKLNTRSNSKYDQDDVVEDLVDYYQLFQQRKLICEARECNIIATKELKIPIGIYGERVFFFCKNCVKNFRGED